MDAVLEKLGLGSCFRALIKALYINQSARVNNGSRQGCPLSPLLYILTLEPLLRCICMNSNIKVIEVRGREYKIAAFVDDVLLFLTSPLTSLPNLMQVLEQFRLISNLKINFSKSFALNITLALQIVQQCQMNFPFSWKTEAITYLGIQLPSRLADLYDKNFLSELKNLQLDINRWNMPTISWFGCASIIKITVLPRILYKIQTIPICLPPSFFTAYKKMCRTFLWGSREARMKWAKLVLPKSGGGISLPDLQRYYWATCLTRIVDWKVHTQV